MDPLVLSSSDCQTSQTIQISACQTHILGEALIPQRLRSLRKIRARPPSPDCLAAPAKRRCTLEDSTEPNEAAIAQMLLGLSHSPRSSSIRESDISTSDEEIIVRSPCRKRALSRKRSPAKSLRGHLAEAKPLRSEELDEDFELECPSPGRTSKSAKKLPGRCKCGKRVSAAHPPCKSELMLLCERFCERCGYLSARGEPTRIHLNECALALGVPRRRLYDITIVYEAVEVVKRTGKLAYVWRGMAHLPTLIAQLRCEEEAGVPVSDRKGNTLLPQQASERQTTHSLWTLSRKFIRLLLTTKGPIQLTDAAEHLIGEHLPAKRQQTQVTVERRLYDIGSILATLNLIHRTYVEGKRQPAFSWNWDWTLQQQVSEGSNGRGVADARPEPGCKSVEAIGPTSPVSLLRLGVPELLHPRDGPPTLPAALPTDLDVRLPLTWSMPTQPRLRQVGTLPAGGAEPANDTMTRPVAPQLRKGSQGLTLWTDRPPLQMQPLSLGPRNSSQLHCGRAACSVLQVPQVQGSAKAQPQA